MNGLDAGSLQQIAVAALVVSMMGAIGLRTDPSEFGKTLHHPLPLVLALVVNVVGVPLLTLAAAHLLNLPAEATTGLLICAVSPGGATGPLFAARAKGQLALAVTTMIGLSMVSVLTAPLTLSLLLGLAVKLDVHRLILPMMGALVAFQLTPLVAGMAFRHVQPERAAQLAKPAGVLANGLLLALILGMLITRGRVLLEIGGLGIAVSIVLVLCNLGMGGLLAREGSLRRSLSMVTGVRNISLALLLSATYFPNAITQAWLLTFALFTMLVPLGVSLILARREVG